MKLSLYELVANFISFRPVKVPKSETSRYEASNGLEPPAFLRIATVIKSSINFRVDVYDLWA